ncbi:hypothetical protein [Nonomuraea sp. NPDC048916]|uniref:hypothetical protein n=1 Tax=Nonomuraea sp. NPDC048916 TaxID=3154232 RepID=UPI0033D39EC1
MYKVRANTLARYRACLRLYFPPPLPKKKLSQLTVKDIRLWLDQLRVTRRCCALGTDAALRWRGPTQPLDDQHRWDTARRLLHDDARRPEDRLAGLLLLLY